MKRASALVVMLAAATAATQPAWAQAYPTKPIRVVVPYAPGGATDLTGRTVGQKLQQSLKQKIIVDNRTGAGGTIRNNFV